MPAQPIGGAPIFPETFSCNVCWSQLSGSRWPVFGFDQDASGQGTGSPPLTYLAKVCLQGHARVKSFTEYFSALQAAQAQLPDSELLDWRWAVDRRKLVTGFANTGIRLRSIYPFESLVRPRNWRYLAPVIGFKTPTGQGEAGRGEGTHNEEFNAFATWDSLQSKAIPVAWLNAMVAFKNSIQAMSRSMVRNCISGLEERTVDGLEYRSNRREIPESPQCIHAPVTI